MDGADAALAPRWRATSTGRVADASRIASVLAAVAVRVASPSEFSRRVPLSRLLKPEGNAFAILSFWVAKIKPMS